MDEDLRESPRQVGFYTAVGALMAFLIVTAIVAATTSNESVRSVALGVIGSIIAAILFATLSEHADTPQSRTLKRVLGVLKSVREIEHDAKARLLAGVIGVSDKRGHQPDYWFSILDAATDKLDMVGNSLSGWVQGEFRARLKQAISRILKEGGRVRIVFMDPKGDLADDKSKLLEKNYKLHIEGFVDLLGELMEEFEESFEAEHLAIYLAADNLTYMLIDNGGDIHVSPYMAVSRADHPLVVQIAGDSPYAEGYRIDFERIVKRARDART